MVFNTPDPLQTQIDLLWSMATRHKDDAKAAERAGDGVAAEAAYRQAAQQISELARLDAVDFAKDVTCRVGEASVSLKGTTKRTHVRMSHLDLQVQSMLLTLLRAA